MSELFILHQDRDWHWFPIGIVQILSALVSVSVNVPLIYLKYKIEELLMA